MTSSAGNSHTKSHVSERSSATVSGPAPGFFLLTSGVFLAVGGLVWGFCEAPGDSRDAEGCQQRRVEFLFARVLEEWAGLIHIPRVCH